MEPEWKASKPVRSFCVRHAERVTVDVRPSANLATNVRAKGKRYRANMSRFRFQLVSEVLVLKSEHVRSSIGVENGQTMRVNLGVSEVFVTFRVKASERFRRDGGDIHSEINVSIAQATLGGTAKVPGIYEDHVLPVRNSIESTGL